MYRSSMPGMRKLAVAVLVGSVGINSCDRLVDPPLPEDAEVFTPPAVFATWWQMTEACSGLTGSLSAVTWYKTNEVLRDPRTGDGLVGYWSAPGNRIVMSSLFIRDGAAVRHEMLHALIRQPGHPRSQFLGKCGGTVSCASACVADAGAYPIPPETPISVGSESIDITVDIVPQNPTSAQDDGFFTITVAVRNLSPHWATIAPLSSGPGDFETFRFEVSGPSGGMTGAEIGEDPSQKIFAPGETKRHVFDFVIGDDAFGRQLPAGDYVVRGGYSPYWSQQRAFSVGP